MFGTDISDAWMYYADRNYVLTRFMSLTDFLIEAPVNAHRTMELYLKAYLVSKGEKVAPGEAVWGHNLIELNVHCSKYDTSFTNENLTRRLAYFQRYFDLVRYPTSIENRLTKGTGIWFSWDSCITPLDEVVAFIRPRIQKTEDGRKSSWIDMLYSSTEERWSSQKKALITSNPLLDQILCKAAQPSEVDFSDFTLDLPGC